MEALLGVFVRLSVMYVYALAMLRLTGKRSLGALSALDFITTLIVGDLFDNIFWGTTPLANGLLAISVLTFLHVFTSALGFYFRPVRVWLQGSQPVLVVKNSRFDRKGLASERTSEAEVYSSLRELGEENLTEVREAFWEPNGRMSVLKKAEAKNAQKKDVDRLRGLPR